MNKSKVTKRKGSKTKTGNESTEVFVLPPNLLEQLGINLGNIGSTSENTVQSQVTDTNIISKEKSASDCRETSRKHPDNQYSTSSKTESSIIETAKLMKKSVFLSPTFISNNTSTIQGEIEIVGSASGEDLGGKINGSLINNEYSDITEVSLEMQQECVTISNMHIPNSTPLYLSSQETQQCSETANDNVEMQDVKMQTLFDDHADEAYSSDCSNSNLGCNVDSNVRKNNPNKISIISEQIILPSQFYKMKGSYSPQRNSLIHVSINTMISSHRKNNINHQNVSNLDLISNDIADTKTIETTIVNNTMNDENCIKEISKLSKVEIEELKNINKTDVCAVLNKTESELIIGNINQADFEEVKSADHVDVEVYDNDTEIRMILDEGSKYLATNTEIFTENVREKEIDTLKVIGTESSDENKDLIFLSDIISHDSKTEPIGHTNADATEIDNTTSPVFQKSDLEENKHIQVFSPARQSYPELLLDSEVFKLSEQKNVAQNYMLQNGEADCVNQDKDTLVIDNQQSHIKKIACKSAGDSQSLLESNIDIHNINKIKQCSKDISGIKILNENTNTSTIDAIEISAQSPILSKHYKEDHGTIASDDNQYKQKDIRKCNEFIEIKFNHNESGSDENSQLQLDSKNKTVIQEDKVREIANYLSRFADLQKKNNFNEIQKIGSKTLSNRKHSAYSKSSIQGVEKPGGSEINKQNKNELPLKTYGRKRKQSCKIPLYVFNESNTPSQCINLAEMNSKNTGYEMEICLCDDFGRFLSYDNENNYGHIHFWNNATTACTPDVIFSIYNEETHSLTIDDSVKSDIADRGSETFQSERKLCWNEIKSIYENGFNDVNDEGNERLNDIDGTEINILPGQEGKKIEINKCNIRLKTKEEPMTQNEIITISQNDKGMSDKKTAGDQNSEKTGKKRTHSAILGSNEGEPPVKKCGKTPRVKAKVAKETTTNSAKQAPTFLNKASSISVEKPLNKVAVTGQQSSIPIKDSPVNTLEQPSTTVTSVDQLSTPVNEETSFLAAQPDTSVNIVTTAQEAISVNYFSTIVCGVCQQSVEDEKWIQHISLQHNYLAWKCGERSLDVDNEAEVRDHLYNIAKLCGGLQCAKCGLSRKHVKAYLRHIRRCSGSNEQPSDVSCELRNEGNNVKVENEELVKCGVCENPVQKSDWAEHIAARHDYLAWKHGDPTLDVNDEVAVREHLYEITKACGGLTCAKCGLTRKYVKAYLSHIRSCSGRNESQNDSTYNVSSEIIPEIEISKAVNKDDTVFAINGLIKCGVCEESLQMRDWNRHIASRHDYLAWKVGDSPLDVNDEAAVREHLYEITKACGGLTCAKCGLTRKYVKAYLSHVQSCNGLNESQNDSTYNTSTDVISESQFVSKDPINNNSDGVTIVVCGVCNEKMQDKEWHGHIFSEHDYLAWKLGEPPLDVNDKTAVHDHLNKMVKEYSGLTCRKCGVIRKYVQPYLKHIKNCDDPDEFQNDNIHKDSTEVILGVDTFEMVDTSSSNASTEEAALVNCGVCGEYVIEQDWNKHILLKHDYLAWKCGEPNLDVNDEDAVRKHLYDISKANGGLSCPKCGVNKKYAKSYLDHVKSCFGPNDAKCDSAFVNQSPTPEVLFSVEQGTPPEADELVKCGVCGQYMVYNNWIHHSATQHENLAWKDGEPPFDVNDAEEIREHLEKLLKENGHLACPKCALVHKCVNNYLHHLKKCDSVRGGTQDNTEVNNSEMEETNPFKCGVCDQVVENCNWAKHLSEEHNYLAWKVGESPLNVGDKEQVQQYLYNLSKQFGGLTCKYCGKTRKYVKSYLEHIKTCDQNDSKSEATLMDMSNTSQELDDSVVDFTSPGTCGVCHKEVAAGQWIQHTQKEHNYLAWREGETPWVCDQVVENCNWAKHLSEEHNYLAWKVGESPLNLGDKEQVQQYLYNLSKQFGGLTCKYCGKTRKYVKSYLEHIKTCDQNDRKSEATLMDMSNTSQELDDSVVDFTSPGTCGVCHKEVAAGQWIQHTQKEHNYLAWREGETPWDVNDAEEIREHLEKLIKENGHLACPKCDLVHKCVNNYLHHLKKCDSVRGGTQDNTEVNNSEMEETNPFKCGVCDEVVENCNWAKHLSEKHNYLAWKVGESPLNLGDKEQVQQYLYNLSKQFGGLTCKYCGKTRKYVKSYLEHIKTCDQNDRKSEATLMDMSNTSQELDDSVVDFTSPGTCGACHKEVAAGQWTQHTQKEHNYLAWREGETPWDVNDAEEIREHLEKLIKENGHLACPKCDLVHKCVNNYLHHLKKCDSVRGGTQDNTEVNNSEMEETNPFKCGVCDEVVENCNWAEHLSEKHNYLAWKVGESPLNLGDKEQVQQYLYNLSKQFGGLTCKYCGKTRKYVKSYLEHIKTCDQNDRKSEATLMDMSNTSQELDDSVVDFTSPGTCGACHKEVAAGQWTQHTQKEHNYLAWREGETPWDVNDAEEIREHLEKLIKENGHLACPKCDLVHKCVNNYLHHLKKCDSVRGGTQDNTEVNNSEMEETNPFKCGVCDEVVENCNWAKHLSEEHNYLAWKVGESPLNLGDKEQVLQYLYNLSKQFGGLTCKYCGKTRKYVKSYLEHIKTCDQNDSNSEATLMDMSNTSQELDDSVVDFTSPGTCAVCHKEVAAGQWIQHTQKEHNYLAWREGETPWDVDDFANVNKYLYLICKRMDGLTCNKCDIVRKYVKVYLTHIKSCNLNTDSSFSDGIGPALSKDAYQCAMCNEQIKPSKWKKHAMESHYNVTWIVGETPIDIKNPYAVERFLKEYKHTYGRLKCRTCGATRASFSGFYAHIITCGKNDEEIEMFKSMCEICNNKYLCIYKNQHAMMHKVQMYTAELKSKAATEKEEETGFSGKRRAAVKARTVIENYSDNMSKHPHTCQSCGFGTELEEELKTHKCEVSNEKDFSGDDSSDAQMGSSDDESSDSDVDSNISNEVNDDRSAEDEDNYDEPLLEPKKRIRVRESAAVLSKVTRIPFKVDLPNVYIREGDNDFCKTHFTDDVLFPTWQCECEVVPEVELKRYMPPLEQSCKVKTGSDWTTMERFEAKRDVNGIRIFVGASIACIAWIPPRVKDIDDGTSNFLAIACHNGPDCPRYQGGETPTHENLIQVWDFSAPKKLPQFAFGIAHDFGTVWSMDWCPSGARDVFTDEETAPCRLGLLAVACSNGSVYIFAVPYPSTVVKDNQFIYKLKPVTELRMSLTSERKRYQATSVSWSKQKTHKIMLVGYANGSTAYYDLHSTSPLLCTKENDMQVICPYQDDRSHNTCITGTDLYPVSGSGTEMGAGVAAYVAPTGAQMVARAGAAGSAGRARLQVAALGVKFAPHACAAVVAGDDAIMHTAISELVWVPPGRRLGPVRTMTGCARCGRVVASTPPTLRIMRPHPAYFDLQKQIVGLLEMVHLARKRKKQVNDELAMAIEPLTYTDAINKYGIEFKSVSKSDKVMQQQCAAKLKAHGPERFPLADIKSMAFCPTRKYHEQLAIATHAGIVFLMTIK